MSKTTSLRTGYLVLGLILALSPRGQSRGDEASCEPKGATGSEAAQALAAPLAQALVERSPGQESPPLSIREQSREAVRACAAKVAEGATRDVDTPWTAVCRKPSPEYPQGMVQGDHATYRLIRESDDTIRIKADIELEIIPSNPGGQVPKARRDYLFEMTKACMPVLNQYWNRYGITLDFSFKAVSGKPKTGATPGELANRVQVTDGTGRSHSRNFYFQGIDIETKLPSGQSLPGGPAVTCVKKCGEYLKGFASSCKDLCEPARQAEYCNMLVHEFGHRLALPDEYADPMCPDREFVSQENNPYSIMAVPQMGMLDVPPGFLGIEGFEGLDTGMVEFYPRHIQRVIGPLCGE